MATPPSPCGHPVLHLDVSPYAAMAGFERPSLAERQAAATPSGRAAGSTDDHARLESLLPGPLVLPGDGLAIEPKEPPQSLRSWTNDKLRNPITNERQTIYVAAVDLPSSQPLRYMLWQWLVPFVLAAPLKGGCDAPKAEWVRKYLEAFYSPLPTKLLPDVPRFVPWTDRKSKPVSKQPPRRIGLQTGDSITRITTRPCPDKVYPRQLNLNDMLDAAIDVLPEDAYVLVMLTNHDLYGEEGDDFCCGRAYGNSRVAVVSSARYHPLLDKPTGIDRGHMWPFSHCDEYVRQLCHNAESPVSRPAKRRKATVPVLDVPVPKPTPTEIQQQPMTRVVRAGLAAYPNTPTGLWLSRMVRTVSHELGHCLCLDHCSYYACVMQGTAGIAEDLRRPPYLCLVCEAKLARGIRDLGERDEAQCLIERYALLDRFCDIWKQVSIFAAYRCWLEERTAVTKEALPAAEEGQTLGGMHG